MRYMSQRLLLYQCISLLQMLNKYFSYFMTLKYTIFIFNILFYTRCKKQYCQWIDFSSEFTSNTEEAGAYWYSMAWFHWLSS